MPQRELPVLFSAPMVRAILAGTKTQTRRLIRGAAGAFWDHAGWAPVVEEGRIARWVGVAHGGQVGAGAPAPVCPFGDVGDRLFWTMSAPSWAGQTPEERFWARVVKTPSCWEWLGGVTGHSRHGHLKIGQSSVSAHRYSWRLHNEDPGDKQVLHTCDVGWCVNPAHLYLGTSLDNRRDQTERGRIRHLHGSGNPASKLADGAADEIRRLYAAGVEQADLAQRYDVTQPHISKIVNAKRRCGPDAPPLALLGSRWLEVTAVRVQRLREIGEDDARAEGIEHTPFSAIGAQSGFGPRMCTTARQAFEDLWDAINGKRAPWASNPWIWAISFRRLQP